MPVNIIIVDDHDMVRTCIKRLLADVEDVAVIGEASSGEEAIALVKEKQPQIVLMDVRMPGTDGLEATIKIMLNNPSVKIITLSACVSEPWPTKLLKAGVAGYLSKDSSLEEMLLAIKTVAAGKRYLSPDIAQKLALKSAIGKEFPLDELSKRELEVMNMIISGKQAKNIAKIMGISSKTVNSYRQRMFNKLGVKTDVELTHFAARHGVLDMPA